jgi:hypothetical protein
MSVNVVEQQKAANQESVPVKKLIQNQKVVV